VIERLGRSFARFATDVVVRRPALWPLFRRLIRLQFDRIAPSWDVDRNPHHLAAFERALERVDAPRRALDLGTGTGDGAFAVARRFPEADVVGVDLAEAMLAEARRKTPGSLQGRVRFEPADAERLPYEDSAFDLVTLANMIPFFDELARVTAPGGSVLFSFSVGPETPIYVPFERLRAELEPRGFTDFADFAADGATAFLARKGERL
jgi:ubiquinone/menaquinone biosynthesis C-methylase UbiE